MKSYTLYDMVVATCGDIIPRGETYYDRSAYRSMGEVMELLDNLIDDVLVVADVKGNEASILTARSAARFWLSKKVLDIVDDRCACKDDRRWLLNLADDIKQRLDEDEEVKE